MGEMVEGEGKSRVLLTFTASHSKIVKLSSSKTACLQEDHTTRQAQLYWVSPRVLSSLQSCPLQVLGGG